MFEMISLEELGLTDAELEAVHGAQYDSDAYPNHASRCMGLITGMVPSGSAGTMVPITLTIAECCTPTCDCHLLPGVGII